MLEIMPYILLALFVGGVLLLAPSMANAPTIPRNNPGNIRPSNNFTWNGQIGVQNNFVVFDSLVNGVRASYINLRSYFNNGHNTIEKIVNRWAPPSDNNPTENYIKFVEQKSGIPRNQVLQFSDEIALKILSPMFHFEHGKPLPTNIINAGFALA